MKEQILAIFLLLLAGLTVWAIAAKLPEKEYARPASDFTDAIREGTYSPTTASPAVANEVIRLHILADSDNDTDQRIKLALRDILLPYINAATLGAKTKAEALAQLKEQCGVLTEIANQTLARYHAGYAATVSVETVYFPIRIYGTQTYLSQDAVVFPPGFYDSVQVVLGSGEGHNWWCLAYPSLCFIDSTYDYVPKESDIYKLKIGKTDRDTLAELFYGSEFTVQEFTEKEDVLPASGIYPSKEEEITLHFSFKLWELVKALWKKD